MLRVAATTAVICAGLAAICPATPEVVLAAPASDACEGIERIECPKPFGLWVTALPDGGLMTWWPEEKAGAADATGTVQVALARFSHDDGATWTRPRVLFEFPRVKGKARYLGGADGVALCDRQGGIHVFGVLCRVAFSWETYKGNLAVFHVMSDDNGKTWSDVQIVPTGYNYCGIHQPLVAKTGRIILPIWHVFDDKRKWGAFCVLSDDRGKTWRAGSQVVAGTKGAPARFQLDEQSGVELDDGRIWMLFRELQGGHLIEAVSKDGGKSWQNVRESRFVSPAAPPAMLRLTDGRILLVWNNSLKPKHVFNRLILAAAISADEGKTWRGYREIARTSGAPGPQGWVCYPFITQTNDGTVIVSYGTAKFRANLLRLDPDWLEQTRLREDFSTGLENWIILQTEGPKLVPHPSHPDRKVLALPKPKADRASGASLNFPFGAKGKLTMRIQLEQGFRGTRICLTDHFTWPSYSETGQFGCNIWADGEIVEPLPEGKLVQSGAKLTPGEWHALEFAWDCKKHVCALSVDSKLVTNLAQMSAAPGVCYLRLWSAAKQTDKAGLLIESVDVNAGDNTVIAFGDSTTAPRDSVPAVYADILRKKLPAYGIAGSVSNQGVGGNTTNQARARFRSGVLAQNPGLVIIQFGINDSTIDVWKQPPAKDARVSLKQYAKNLRQFVDTLRKRHVAVILMTPNPLRWTPELRRLYGKSPYDPNDPDGLNTTLRAYVAKVRRIAADKNVPLVDVAAMFREYGRVPGQAVDDLLLDGMHPNAKGHRLIAERLLKQIQKAIPNGGTTEKRTKTDPSQSSHSEHGGFVKPVVVFWCPKPKDLNNATYITPQVWGPGDTGARQRYFGFDQRYWLKRGITPLRWMGGYCYKTKTEDEFVDYWSGVTRWGYRGIAIDEFGSGDEEVDEKMGRALIRAKQKCPDLFFAVWHAGPLNKSFGRAYRQGADLVMLERYGGKRGFERRFAQSIQRARQAQILRKTVFALGINDRDKPDAKQRWGEWANNPEILEAQVKWIRDHAPQMPGIAFYASHASQEMVRTADSLAGRYWRKKQRVPP